MRTRRTRPRRQPAPRPMSSNSALQAELYQAFFQAWQQAGNSSLTGVYFWNWDPNAAEVGPGQPANFSPQGLPAQGVVTSWFSPPTATAATDNGANEVGVGHVVTITLKPPQAETVTGDSHIAAE